MPTDRFDTFLAQLRRAALRREGGVSDGQLLERYVRHGDAAAFEALVRNHGAMVLGVCRRVLRNWHDAEDAFQATFLVLARKAPSVRPRHRVGNFLYGVAYRTALEARRAAARRRLKEAAAPPRAEGPAESPWAELRPVLDRELSGLPEKYRAPIVLCDLEGRTRREAAHQLGWREGTLSGRLARARVLLARRLHRHGVGLAGGALAAVLGQEAAARVPGPLLTITRNAVALAAAGEAAALPANLAALVQGVNRAMGMTKLKAVALGVLLAGALGGVGVLSYPGRGAAEVPVPARGPSGPAPAPRARAPEPAPVLRPGDCLSLELAQSGERVSWNVEVRPDGTVRLGNQSPLQVEGRTVEQVREAVVGLLKERTRDGKLTEEDLRRGVRVTAVFRGDGRPPVVEKRSKQYQVSCPVIQLAKDGRDFGEYGKGKVLTDPTMRVEEGKEACCQVGGEQGVPFLGEGAARFIPVGVAIRVTVRGGPDGKLQVDAVLERSEAEPAPEGTLRVRGHSVRGIEYVKLGEAMKLVEKDDRGEPRYQAVVRVTAEEEVISRSRTIEGRAVPEETVRVGQIFTVGNKYVPSDVIRREVSLQPGQVLTYTDLKAAERKLEKLGMFRVEPDKGIRPRVDLIESDDPPGTRDVVITVEEKAVTAPARPPRP